MSTAYTSSMASHQSASCTAVAELSTTPMRRCGSARRYPRAYCSASTACPTGWQ
ncbi:hypothetical protein ABT324_32355 [Saccharopolyspora sp. NPDC000359]|uniref:hypothetical protein n=1 Tax=Saccharopolyspora sp. NPDC000359 TaxID=3154251 RepID=UPI0033303900